MKKFKGSRLKNQESRLKAQDTRLKAQESRLKAQGTRLKAQVGVKNKVRSEENIIQNSKPVLESTI